jgi:hypothetical protein
LSQATAAAFEDSELQDGFKAVVELLFVRMKRGICDEDIKLRPLQREELVKVIGISKLIRYLFKRFDFKGKHEKYIMKNLSNAITWDEAPAASSEVVMVCSVSAKNMHKLIVDLHEGKLDYVFVEMADESSAKKAGAAVC